MIGGKMNLAMLHHVVKEIKGETGMVKCLVIPIEKNHLFEGKDGNFYLDLIAFDLKNTTKDQTHLVKQSLPKDVREKMTKEELEAMPIIGNLNANMGGGGANQTPNNPKQGVILGEQDDLPF